MVNTDFRMRSMFASLEKEVNGERFRKALIDSLDVLEKSHAQNVKKQKDIDITWDEDYDPDPAPGTLRILVPMPPESKWGEYYQIDQDGNITILQDDTRIT